ncbi:sigma-70 family RNA polymerase sigma factor [Streptomyces sp. J2-1]|nr:sigma-70 family RNA polymerase sigma factor [Streptomyces corallincola]
MTTATATAPAPAPAPAPAQQKQLLHTLIAEHEKALLAYAEKLLNDRHMAEDIVQETLIRAWPHAERLYSTEGSVRGWLLTVTRNLVIDRMRTATARRETVGTEDRDATLPDHSDSVLASVEAAALLRDLSREHREVLLHTYLCDRTVQETARILGIPTGTVKSRQHYALNSLRAKAPGRRVVRRATDNAVLAS